MAKQSETGSVVQIVRPARALLGWLPEDQAVQVLAGQRRDLPISDDMRTGVREARRAVADRPVGVDQKDVITNPPLRLKGHIESLRASPAAKVYFDEGWTVAMADLRKICAVQPHVFTDHAEERTATSRGDEPESLAQISLPLSAEAALPAQYDQVRQAWIIAGPNPNLRIVGNFGGPVQPGVIGFGFVVSILQSFIQVARVNGRCVLRDGHHRAIGFLKRGIETVPVITRDYGEFEELGIGPGLLPTAAYLGPRPPLLVAYFDDVVSADVSLPAFQRMIVIHGLELTPMG